MISRLSLVSLAVGLVLSLAACLEEASEVSDPTPDPAAKAERQVEATDEATQELEADDEGEALHPSVAALKERLPAGRVRTVVADLRLAEDESIEARVLHATSAEKQPWSPWMSGRTFTHWLHQAYWEAQERADDDVKLLLGMTSSNETWSLYEMTYVAGYLIEPLSDVVIARLFVNPQGDEFDAAQQWSVAPMPIAEDRPVEELQEYLTTDYGEERERYLVEVVTPPGAHEDTPKYVQVTKEPWAPVRAPFPYESPGHLEETLREVEELQEADHVVLVPNFLDVGELRDIHGTLDRVGQQEEYGWSSVELRMDEFQSVLPRNPREPESRRALGELATQAPPIEHALLRGQAELTFPYWGLPEPPEIVPEEVTGPPDEEVVDDPTEDPQIVEDAVRERNEDPTDTDAQELREAEVESDSGVDAPDPATGHNPAIGHPGGFGEGNRSDGRRDADQLRHILAALRWLADHQKVDGGWDPVNFAADGKRNGRSGSYDNKDGSESSGWEHAETGLTGLATLAFLAAGYTHQDGEFRRTIHHALRYMRSVQANDGGFGGEAEREHESFMYNHTICTMAMAEAYGMTNTSVLQRPAQRGVDFLLEAQNYDEERGYLGWRYGVRPGISDSSVTGWAALALVSAREAGLEVPARAFEGALRHLDDMTGPIRTAGEMGNGDDDASYRTGYLTRAGFNARLPGHEDDYDWNHSMSAINIATRFFANRDGDLRSDDVLVNQATQIVDDPPTLDDPRKRDYYYWYKASLAMFQMGGEHWEEWSTPMEAALQESQQMSGTEADATYGSWDSVSAWGAAGGRVYTTAINCLTLQTSYRYKRIPQSEADDDAEVEDADGDE